MEWILNFFGFLLIWMAVEVGRKEDSKVKLLSWEFLLQLLLIGAGVFLASQHS